MFGGSVCLLNTNSNNLKIGVGAYRDSENGTNKGAVWILNFGELTYAIESFSNPNCDAMDGNITFSGLEANKTYQVSYNNGSLKTINQNSDPDGRLILTSQSSGTYSDIVVTDVNTKCSKNIGQIELSSFSLNANSAFSNPTTCNAPDGSITISGLSVNRSYSITYNDGSNQFVTQVSDANGTLVLSGLQAGSYSEIEISDPQTGCSENLGQIDLSAPPLTAQISFRNPTSCDAFDGAFMVSGLLENTTYELSYSDYVSHSETLISDANGIIYLNGLPSGIYSNIEVKQINSNCLVNLPDVKLECISREVNQCFKSKQYFTPNGDGQNDFWSLEILDINCDFKLNIFDRYGKLIKTLNPENNKWDGTYRGAKMPADDYWFLVNYFYDSKPYEFKSHFALIR
ncbi:T9SS type B sorting domain-containing protein [Gaetbulibacter aestuarii]|uniref:T9SS type B sorting domain-containing protein n=1 Tax=Gaetbulibacter aestuarii TaxID=1502358 RepID=A0ABW7MWH3_9FLAO